VEIERQHEVRLTSWLCEAIQDTIKRYQEVLESEKDDLDRELASAVDEKKKQNDPVLGQYANPEMYESFVTKRRRSIEDNKLATDQLLALLQSAQGIKRQATEFWEGQAKRWKEQTES
jgi:hypothetical protein